MSYNQKDASDDSIKIYERTWLRPFVTDIPAWHSLAHTRRHLAKEKKRFRVWRLVDQDTPQLLADLHVSDFSCTMHGPVMLLTAVGGVSIQVTHAPQELFPGSNLYLWIPAFFDARYAPTRYDCVEGTARRLTWRFCARMMCNPSHIDRRKVDQVFVSDDEEFLKLWPNIRS